MESNFDALHITTGTITEEQIKGNGEKKMNNAHTVVEVEDNATVTVESFSDGSSNILLNESEDVELTLAQMKALQITLETHIEWMELVNE